MAAPENTRAGKGPEGVQEGEVRTHKDLELWKAAMELAKAVYQVTDRFPKEEVYGMTAQMRRSAVSIPCNIAEGAARYSKKEFIQFLYIALGSLAELETQWILAADLGWPGTKASKPRSNWSESFFSACCATSNNLPPSDLMAPLAPPCMAVRADAPITRHSSLVTRHPSLITHHPSLITHHSPANCRPASRQRASSSGALVTSVFPSSSRKHRSPTSWPPRASRK